MEKIEDIALSSFVCKEDNDVLLVRTDKLFLEAAEDHEKSEHGTLLGIIHVTFFRCIDDEPQDFGGIQVQELFVVFKNFVNKLYCQRMIV